METGPTEVEATPNQTLMEDSEDGRCASIVANHIDLLLCSCPSSHESCEVGAARRGKGVGEGCGGWQSQQFGEERKRVSAGRKAP